MDSPRRSTTNRSRSISITTRRASASSSSQVRTPAVYCSRAPAASPSPRGATRPTATRLIDHATDRDPDDITTLHNPVAARRADSFFSLPLLARVLEAPAKPPPGSIAGRYRVLCFSPNLCLFLLLVYVCAHHSAIVGASCVRVSSFVVPTPIMNRRIDSSSRILLFTWY